MISPLERNIIFSYLWVLKAKSSVTSEPLQYEQSQKILWLLDSGVNSISIDTEL